MVATGSELRTGWKLVGVLHHLDLGGLLAVATGSELRETRKHPHNGPGTLCESRLDSGPLCRLIGSAAVRALPSRASEARDRTLLQQSTAHDSSRTVPFRPLHAGVAPMKHHAVQILPDTCENCAQPVHYSVYYTTDAVFGYDATFCLACDRWLESCCDEPDCTSCSTRPERPSAVPFPMRVIAG